MVGEYLEPARTSENLVKGLQAISKRQILWVRVRRALRKVGRGVVVVLLIGVLLALAGCAIRPSTQFPGKHFNRGKNAVWLGVEWSMDTHSAAEVTALAADLKLHEIEYVFVYTSYLKPAGNFNLTYDHAAEFVQAIKAAQPNLKILAWVGLPLFFSTHNHPPPPPKTPPFTPAHFQQ